VNGEPHDLQPTHSGGNFATQNVVSYSRTRKVRCVNDVLFTLSASSGRLCVL